MQNLQITEGAPIIRQRLFAALRIGLPMLLVGTGGIFVADNMLSPQTTQTVIATDAHSGDSSIICTKNPDGTITCTDQNGNPVLVECTAAADGAISCVDADGRPVDPIIIDNETTVEVEKEVIIEKEVEKQVIVEKEVIIEKTSPILTASSQVPSTPTNGNVTATLSFSREIKLPASWTYGGSKKQIVRQFTANTTTAVAVTDLSGNTGQAPIHITNIDKTTPACSAESTGGGEAFTYTISCNEAVIISGWSKINAAKYSQLFSASQYGKTIEILDPAGNRTTLTLH